MKHAAKQVYLVIATFVVLVLLIVTQVTWILNALELENQNFNHNVVLALNGVKSDITKRIEASEQMKRYLCNNSENAAVANSREVQEVDSIIRYNLQDFGINLDYKFVITDDSKYNDDLHAHCYIKRLNGLLERNGIHVQLEFPDRNRYLVTKVLGMFIISLVLIILVMLSFLIMLRLYRKEKALSNRIMDFVNNVVHEFQTPLSNIGFATSLIRKKQQRGETEKMDEYAGIILNEKDKMRKHVDEILQLSSMENDPADRHDSIDSHDMLIKTAERFIQKIKEAGGTLTTSLKAQQHVLKGNLYHFSNAIANLLDNAIKYNDKEPDIGIATYNSNQFLYIQVKDNGIGISSKNLPYIFDKYYRVSTGNVHNTKGFGLGLTYVKTIVEQHQGQITVSSILGKETTFLISIPIGEHE